MHLLLLDTAQIQSYVFASNRLRENIGASHLVAKTTGDWALQAIRDHGGRTNVTKECALDPEIRSLTDPAVDAEVLYAGGGNVVALFREGETARKVVRALSERVLCSAPELNLVAHLHEWDPTGGVRLQDAVSMAFQGLAVRKQKRPVASPLLGLAVTAACRSTGLPAVGMTGIVRDDPSTVYPASAGTLGRLDAAADARARLQETFPPAAVGDGYAYPQELDDLGRTEGEFSYIAVVHADGNGMGSRLLEVGNGQDDAEYIVAVRNFSAALDAATRTALKATLACIVPDGDRIVWRQNGEEWDDLPLGWDPDSGETLLPFLPLVYGGDDVTLVCDGRLGLALAVKYLQEFERATAGLPDGRGSATACAGIAIVKSHYPFARAYALAESLCRSAKNHRATSDLAGSCLDWHFAPSDLSGSLEEIRHREYNTPHGALNQRPVALESVPPVGLRQWPVIEAAIQEFQKPGWRDRRNKAKALRDVLRAGPARTKQFCDHTGLVLPDIQVGGQSLSGTYPDLNTDGWTGNVCGYFDALEVADFYLPLDLGATDAALDTEGSVP